MGEDMVNHVQALPHPFCASREGNDERVPAYARHRPAQHGHGRELHGIGPHCLGKPGHFFIDYGQTCFRSYVVMAQPGAAGGNNQIHISGVSPLGQPFGDEEDEEDEGEYKSEPSDPDSASA